jgi:hypothetical protein
MDCEIGGKKGKKFGPSGHCYTGADAEAKAKKQGAAEHANPKAHSHSQGEMESFNVLAEIDPAAVRRETFDSVEHLVVPIVALVEGVIHASNADSPELALAEVFGLFPTAWNGRPITFDHPEVKGMKVSASQTPDTFAKESLGFMFNTKLDGKKLLTEAWINLDKVKAAGDTVEKGIMRLESGALVEVSTGLFAKVQRAEGVFEGEKYNGVWNMVVPDHLAILPEGTIGACSIEDGCGGPRVNSAADGCACGGKCGVNVTDNKKDATKKKKMTKIKKGGIQSYTAEEQMSEKEAGEGFFAGLRDKFKGIFKFQANESDYDIRQALLAALASVEPEEYFSIVAVFDSAFVYTKGFDGLLLQRSFSVADGGPVTLGGAVTEVRPVTDFVPINIKEGSTIMANKEVIDALIANSATQYSEDDRQWLSELPVERLNKLSPVANSSAAAEGAEAETQEEKDAKAAADAKTAEDAKLAANAAATPEDFIKNAPAEMQDVLNEGLRMHRSEKETIVKELVKHDRNSFTEKELKAMELSQLRKLSKLAKTPSYEGRAGAGAVKANSGDSEAIPPAPLAFPVKTA